MSLIELTPRSATLKNPLSSSLTENGSVPDWIFDTTLVLDLDLTLIRPAPIFEQRPTAFPLGADGEIQVDCELGRRYLVRRGLAALGNILRLPWRAKLVLSRSLQVKVNEVARKLQIQSVPLSDWMDACIGEEILQEFAARQGVNLSTRSARLLSNPTGRPVKAKPSELCLLRDLRELGASLREGNHRRAMQIVWQSERRSGQALMIDDTPYYEPARDNQACYKVIPFTPIERFKPLCENSLPAAPLQFNFLDFLWRATASPFGYLDFLLKRNVSWPECGKRLNLQMLLANALRRWTCWGAICRRFCLEEYIEYVLERQTPEERLLEARYAEHARVYRAMVDKHIAADVRRGWRVLLLGRDMDYVFQAVCHSVPRSVDRARVVSLPLSRVAVKTLDKSLLARVVEKEFPAAGRRPSRGLRIYDVGYHGTVPAAIKSALGRQGPWKPRRVEARLLNVCGCKRFLGGCLGEVVTFGDWQGKYTLSREFGISIERCPHGKGHLETVMQKGRGFIFMHSPHSPIEASKAGALGRKMTHVLRSREAWRGGESPGFLGHIAKQALARILPGNQDYVSRIRRNSQGWYDAGQNAPLRSIQTVVYPFCGIDLFTPLLCFPKVRHLILIDSFQANISNIAGQEVAESAIRYLAELTSRFTGSPSQLRQSTLEAREHYKHTGALFHRLHALALLSMPIFMSIASLLPVVAMNNRRRPRHRKNCSLCWWLKFEARRPVFVEYYARDFSYLDHRLSVRLKRLLLNTWSALIFTGLKHGADQSKMSRFRAWAEAAQVVVYDDSLIADIGRERPHGTQFTSAGDCIKVITHGENQEGHGPYNFFVRFKKRGLLPQRPNGKRSAARPALVSGATGRGEDRNVCQQLTAS